MKVNGKNYRTVWFRGGSVYFIDQNQLPFEFKVTRATSYQETCRAIKVMSIRGAGAIGAAAGFAMAQAILSGKDIKKARRQIEGTRPTARNLFYATERVYKLAGDPKTALIEAQMIADEDSDNSRMIGAYGSRLIKKGARILTHCNAGWLAFVDHGTALSPIYTAKKQGKRPFVYVDETAPRGQGAKLTAWELQNENVDFKVIADNAAAYLMSRGLVDLAIVGADRIARNGDVANKIGTLEKAICAREFKVPFYVAAPTSTIDRSCRNGKAIPVEMRSEDEVLFKEGEDRSGRIVRIRTAAPGARAVNPAFDITPARLIKGIITEKGIFRPAEISVL